MLKSDWPEPTADHVASRECDGIIPENIEDIFIELL